MRLQQRSVSRRGLEYICDLSSVLVARDMKARYRGSLLGMAWSIITPMLYLLIFYFVFQRLFSLDIPQYASFAFTGLLVWTWFQSALMQAVATIKNNGDLIRKPGFPTAILPVVSVASDLVNFLVALPPLLALLLLEGSRPGAPLLLLPIVMAIQFVGTLSLAYLAAAVNVTFRDTQHIIGVLLQLGFFVTPIFYNIELVPGKLRFFYLLNPMAHLISAYRRILMDEAIPDGKALAIIAVASFLLLGIGNRVFKKASARFVEEL